jgi:hypothetical protein
MRDRSKVMTQTKSDTLVLQIGVGSGADISKKIYVEITSTMPRMGLMNRRGYGCKRRDLIFGTWHIRTLKVEQLYLSALPIKTVQAQHITALQETMMLGKDFMDMKSHILFYTRKEKGTREFVVTFLVDTCTKGMYLTLKAVDDSTRIVRIKTKFLKFYKCTSSYRGKGRDRKQALYKNAEEVCGTSSSNDILLGGFKRQNRERRSLPGSVGRESTVKHK